MRVQTLLTPDRREVALVALFAFVSAVIASAVIWENEDIEYKLLPIKAWAAGDFPHLVANHHNLRWAINFPAVAWVFLFGDAPQGYLILNYLIFAASTAGIYALARAVGGKSAALSALALWFFNPAIYWLTPNLMPELYSVFYLVLGLNLLHAAYTRESLWLYAAAMLAFFGLYGAKETNLFFMPGLGLYELAHRRWDRVGVMIAVMGGGFVLETLLVDWAMRGDGLWFGRVQALANGKHVHEMRTIFSHSPPSDILRRWGLLGATNLERLEYYSKLLYLTFFAGVAWLGWRAWGRRDPVNLSADKASGETLMAATAMGASFAFFTTFFIISVQPFILGEPLVDRYLWVLLVPACLLLAVLADRFVGAAFARAQPPSGVMTRLARWPASPIVFGIVALATLSRVGIDWAVVHVRRDGFARAYDFLTVNAFFRDSIRTPLEQGCTVVFASRRAAWSGLIYAFPYGYIAAPERLYNIDLDGLPLRDGGVVRGWRLNLADWPDLGGRLYTGPGVFEAYALRLEGPNVRRCARTHFVGDLDINPVDQAVAPPRGATAAPPPIEEP